MGKRGPAKTPTKILDMRGSWRGKERVDEPQPDSKRPTCPAWLLDEAKRMWKELVPQLERMGVLGLCDRGALTRYCQTWAKWRATEEWLMEHVAEVMGSTEPPQVGRAIRLADQLLRLEQQFGLTPSARAGLAKPKDNPEENRGRSKGRFFANG